MEYVMSACTLTLPHRLDPPTTLRLVHICVGQFSSRFLLLNFFSFQGRNLTFKEFPNGFHWFPWYQGKVACLYEWVWWYESVLYILVILLWYFLFRNDLDVIHVCFVILLYLYQRTGKETSQYHVPVILTIKVFNSIPDWKKLFLLLGMRPGGI